MVIHKCPQEPRIASLFTLLHLHFGWSQKGPIFLLFLPFCICLEVPPAVHASVPTLLDTKMMSRKTRATMTTQLSFPLNILTENVPARRMWWEVGRFKLSP